MALYKIMYLLLIFYTISTYAKISNRSGNKNYQLNSNWKKHYCSSGYATYYTALGMQCLPICPYGCPLHSTCTGPNSCECDTGYKIKGTQCQPVCEGCHHGFCYRPDHCICDFGYRLNSDHACVPVCRDDCVNGSCVAPDVCECQFGFRLTRVVKDYCEPNCRPACINTDCSQPEICLCPHANDLQQNEWHAVSTSTPTDHLKCVRVDDGQE